MSSVSVVVPALNEEKNIENTVTRMRGIIPKYFTDHEILLFNDGSTDQTGSIIDRLRAADPQHIRAIHHRKPCGLGYVYKQGVKQATGDYIIMIPGDDEIDDRAIHNVLAAAGKPDRVGRQADMVVPYTSNQEIRPWLRRIISHAYTGLVNLLFGFRLAYYNGIVLHRRELIQSVNIETDSFFYQAEALIKLLDKGVTYVEVGAPIKERLGGTTKAFKLKNVYRVARDIISLFIKQRIMARKQSRLS